jgi:hypothetical protein
MEMQLNIELEMVANAGLGHSPEIRAVNLAILQNAYKSLEKTEL